MNEPKKKFVLWEGWRKEIFWFIFFLCLFAAVYGHMQTQNQLADCYENVCELCDIKKGYDIMKVPEPSIFPFPNLTNLTVNFNNDTG